MDTSLQIAPQLQLEAVFINEPLNAPAHARYLVVDGRPFIDGKRTAIRLFRTSDQETAVWVREFWRRDDFSVWPGEARYLT